MRTRTKVAWWIGGVLGVATLATVALHLAPVRGLLGMKPLGTGTKSAFCPFGYGKQPATEAHAPRPIPTEPRPALGFALDVSGPADLALWAAAHGIHCTPQHGGSVLECADLAAATTLWFRFDGLALAAIQTSRRAPDARGVATAFDATTSAISAAVGTPTTSDGSASADDLARGALRQAMVEYRRPGYHAVVRATNMGDGFVLTESYATGL